MKKYFIILLLAYPAIAFSAGISAAGNIAFQFVTEDIVTKPIVYSQAKTFRKYFSADLKKVFDETLKQEQLSIKNTPKGEKPCIPDSELFFSNAEGVNEVKILNETVNGAEKDVNVQLTYLLPGDDAQNQYPLNQWKATIMMFKEKNRWVIDDIKDSASDKTFKQGLTDNLKTGCYAVQ